MEVSGWVIDQVDTLQFHRALSLIVGGQFQRGIRTPAFARRRGGEAICINQTTFVQTGKFQLLKPVSGSEHVRHVATKRGIVVQPGQASALRHGVLPFEAMARLV